MLLRLDKMLYYDWGMKVWIGPYQMFTRAAGSPPLLNMFDSLPVLVITTARPAQSIRRSLFVFLLNNRFQFQETWSQNC